MTQEQARAFVALVKQEFPGQIETSIGRSRGGQSDYGYIVRLVLTKQYLVLTAYQPSEWPSIKQAWSWWLGIEVEEAPTWYLVDGVPMIFERQSQYWYGRYQKDRKTVRKYLGRNDPRDKYEIVEKKEEVAI